MPPGIDPNAPMSVGAFVGLIVGISALISTALVYWKFWMERKKFVREAAEAEQVRIQKEDEELRKLITMVCREYSEEPQRLNQLDRRISEIAVEAVEQGFRQRSSSFEDAKAAERTRVDFADRIARLESIMLTIEPRLVAAFKESTNEILKQITGVAL